MTTSERADPNYSAAQQAAFQRAFEERLVKHVRAIELRKWSIDKAVTIWIEQQPERRDGESKVTFTDPITLAKEIYDFVRAE